MRAIVLVLFMVVSGPSVAFCFEEAGLRYKIDPLLLQAIGIKESRLEQKAVNHNRDSSGRIESSDYGVMQINTKNAEALIDMQLISSPTDLLRNACFNVHAGAWVLARHLRVCGNTWRCLGSYNAGFKLTARQESRRLRYSAEVRQIYNRLKSRSSAPANVAIR